MLEEAVIEVVVVEGADQMTNCLVALTEALCVCVGDVPLLNVRVPDVTWSLALGRSCSTTVARVTGLDQVSVMVPPDATCAALELSVAVGAEPTAMA